ncbi:MAG: efflux RND transporter permease subunit [Pseudomonadales bacterium]|jgi:multidrug efflux pump subunit AcrB|nr:efflux RND transporter permease subunit [Pseudomonadales bacterium]MCP5319369.1 efflux RND transporter permease subunit [Pseudomonadales bacterium]MCP5336908.1 efflux RND transporter permease subunit [Pseudomonadales bacterium]
MNPGEYALRNPLVSWLFVLLLCAGGTWGFLGMGKLEDPDYTIKMAKVITWYPGASAAQVQEEVTYHIEDAIQRMEQVKRLRMSISRPGVSDILIEFKDSYRAAEFPAIFDELRRKISDVRRQLPPGAQDPIVVDDFGDIYGVYVILSGDDYSWRDLWDTADTIKRELLGVRGVRKVAIEGEQREVVYVDISRAKLGELGVSPQQIAAVLQSQNLVADAGRVRVGDELLRIEPSGEFASVAAMGDVLIGGDAGRLVRLSDVARITRAYEDVPGRMFYVDGRPGLSIGVSMLQGENVVEVGARVRERLAALTPVIPVGMELKPVYDQPTAVASSVQDFQVNVVESLAIVLAVLLLFMGLRVGLVIGVVLLITIAGTLFLMHVFDIELHRMSLGALIIALGMLVDNAIVVAEGMLVRLQAGAGTLIAARDSVGRTVWPLFGGTAIGIVAFSPIAFSPDTTGEFAGWLFWVVLISLLLSWITAITTTPLLAALAFRKTTLATPHASIEPYRSRGFRLFRALVATAMRHRWITIGVTLLLFGASLAGFGAVKTGFFPASNTAMMFVDIWEPEGTDIRRTREDALQVSKFLAAQSGVKRTSIAVGGPHQRFTLVYDVKEMSDAYAQIIVQPDSLERITELGAAVKEFMHAGMPWTDPVIKQLRIGPGRDSRIELRFSGRDAEVLRGLAEQAKAMIRADGGAIDIRDDWREPVKVLRPVFDEQLGRRLGITREDLARSLQYAVEGAPVGLYRDGIRLLPIRIRAPESERGDISELRDVPVWSPLLHRAVPVSQVVSGFETRWENALLRSRDRQLTITVSCNPIGEEVTPLFRRLETVMATLDLPPGYTYAWGGEFEDAGEASEGLRRSLPFGFLAMVLISVLLFGRLRQPLIIWLTVPLALIGITAAMRLSGATFDFMSIVGGLALAGLLIKNAIVLIEEIDLQIGAGHPGFEAVLDATVSRLRPVALAAATTILGMIPLLGDAFFRNMAITMMGGLGFATVLTLFVVPALYLVIFRIPPAPDGR